MTNALIPVNHDKGPTHLSDKDLPSVIEVNVTLLEFSKLSLLYILFDRSEFLICRNFILFSGVGRFL